MNPVFFIDYDNTIFSHQTASIPESAVAALKMLQEKGCPVAIASGRSLRTSQLPEELRERFTPDCFVSSNGAIVEIEGKLVWEKYFDPDLQKRILDYVLEKQYCLTCGYNNIWYTSNIDRFMKNISPARKAMAPRHGKDFLELYEKRVPSFFLADSREAIDDLQAHFPEVKLLYMGDNLGGADIIPRENGKVIGAKRVLDHYHTDLSNAVAIGDSMNDLELIRAAGFGIAMGNAMTKVQAIADYVTADIDHDGLAQAINQALTHFADQFA